MKKNQQIEQLINHYQLQPHPEGGYYVEIFRSQQPVGVSKEKYGDIPRTAFTSIYFLIPAGDFSAWHRLKSEEIWCYHHGDPVILMIIDKQGHLVTQTLGNPLQIKDAQFQIMIPGETWLCAYNASQVDFSLISCIAAPAFEFIDFELADCEKLSIAFPAHQEIIKKFTRASASK